MNTKLLKLKEDIKKEAVQIRKDKNDLKEVQRAGSYAEESSRMYKLMCDRDTLRHKHVAYSLALGNSYEQIEPKVREGNEISWFTIEKIQRQYEIPMKETING